MSQLPAARDYYADLLYGLLPEVYRGRDGQGELRRFLALFGHELGRLRGNLDQLRADLYIDSCEDWVVPYLADLVATEIVFNDAARNRADVRDTIRWRRQKGTLAGLEDVAAGISGRGALAVEMFERLIWTQHLGHRRPRARHTVDLADATAVAKLGTPFETACRTVDLRPPGAAGGLHQLRHVAAFGWDLLSFPRRGGDPAAAGGGRFRFHPLGIDAPLYAGGDRGSACAGAAPDPALRADLCAPHADHVPIRGRDLRDHAERYFGQPPGFTVYEDGIALCRSIDTAPSRSAVPAEGFGGLRAGRGIVAADPGLFGGADFRVEAVLLRAQTTIINGQPSPVAYSPAAPFAVNFAVAGAQGRLDTGAMAYGDGQPFDPRAPQFHRPFLLLAISRLGAAAGFPESEVVVQGAAGARLLVYLPALAGLAAGQPVPLYVADDGSTYFARAAHDAGAADRNPDATSQGAYLPRHLARGALGQVRPRPGVRPVAFRRPVQRDLCCWDQPPQRPPAAGEVAFDPERGRFLCPAGEVPAGELTVDFRFALAEELGAGPFFRGTLPAPTLTVSRSGAADHDSIQDAIDAAPDGSLQPVVIQVQDSRTYREALTIAGRSFPAGLVIQAAATEAPVVSAPAGDVLTVAANSTIGSAAGPGAAASGMAIDGLVLAGGDVVVNGTVRALAIRFCALHVPTVAVDYAPAAAAGPARLELVRTLAGAVTASAAVAVVSAEDAVLHHPAATALHPEGGVALDAAGRVRLERATVIGRVRADAVEASNSILLGAFQAAHPELGCLRYSRWHPGSPVARSFRCTGAYPVFQSLRPGHPAYAAL
ncbi:MAG TPA: phage tail protein, partial [Longimicrobiaceae bacterium]|nr:phage tail protein [Longimicrobiaceae bacterium]